MSTENGLHPQPAWSVVAAEQIRAVGLAVRSEAALVAALLLGFMAFSTWAASSQSGGGIDFGPSTFRPIIWLSFLLPLVVWKAEQPERRTYLWSLPVTRSVAQLTKVGSGWAWLMVGVAAYALWGLATAAITGGEIWAHTGEFVMRWDYPRPEGALPTGSERFTVEIEWWRLLVPFVSATAIYLLGSALVLASNYPIRWIAGFVLLFPLIFLHTYPAIVFQAAMTIFGGNSPLGIFRNLLDPVELVPVRAEGTNGMVRYIPVGQLGSWLSASATWVGVGLAATILAARKHREP